jgi:FkbM family methyltransferase
MMRNIFAVEPWLVPYIPKHGDVALDIGAHKGFWSSDLASMYRVVHAFEANPANVKELIRGVINGDNDNVVVWPVLVGSDPRSSRPFYLYEDSVHGTIFGNADSTLNTADRGEPKKRIDVIQVSLDSLRIEKADFVKIDVEGAEYEVLLGANRLARSRPTWLIEIHSEDNRDLCTEWLETRGFAVQQIPHPHGGFPGHLWLLAK